MAEALLWSQYDFWEEQGRLCSILDPWECKDYVGGVDDCVGIVRHLSHSTMSTILPESINCRESRELRWTGTVRIVAVLEGWSG